MTVAYTLAKKLLFQMNPELAHAVTMANLGWAVQTGITKLVTRTAEEDPVEVMGLRFPNTIGLAAGMDKNGIRVTEFGALGFGHVEIGTVTPVAQPGNDKPRLFRLIPAGGIVNRMGFNNEGCDKVLENLRTAAVFRARGGILGINIGKNKVTPLDRANDDYCKCLDKVYTHADYIAINISSPNTPNLRQMQGDAMLVSLLKAITDKRRELQEKTGLYKPFALKVAPDQSNDEILRIADRLVEYGIDAIIATNTTIARDKVQGLLHADEAGGLSGRPLFERSTEVVDALARHLKGELPIIASGGVMSADDAVAKMQAGARLVQLYTGFIFTGPMLIPDAVEAIARWRRDQR